MSDMERKGRKRDIWSVTAGKIISIVLNLSLVIGFFSGCGKSQNQSDLTISGFAFDTTYTITLYDGGSKQILDSCVSKCSEYERFFSRTLQNSELYQINEIEALYGKVVTENTSYQKAWEQNKVAYGKADIAAITETIEKEKADDNGIVYQIQEDGQITFSISEMMEAIVNKGLEYSKESDGGFDIAIEPITSLWDFKSENPEVPEEKEIQNALSYVDYRKLLVEDGTLTFFMPGMGVDLGGIAKGFIADDLKEYLKQQGVKGAIINLGGNVLCIGSKQGNKPFLVGIQQPFAQRNQTVAAVSIEDMSVVSSGIYERYFETKDGTLYHHIINPKTGYSYDNNLLGVTILSKKSVDGDGLSTTCFALGKEKGLEYINSLENVYAMFITKDEKLWYSDGFEDFLIE